MDAGTLRAVEVWHRRCLAKDTKIAMSDGGYKLIQDIIAGDTVLSFNNGKLTTNIVKGLFKNGKTKVRKYNDLFCTPDHKVLNYHKKKYEEISNTSHLVNAGELSFGYNHDPELAEILGLLLTDGYIKKNQTPKFTNIDERLLRRFEKLIKMRFPDIITKRYKKGNGFDIVCPTRVKTNYHPLRKFFKTSNTFPEIVWGFDKESSLAFLNGVISGDGSISFKETETPRGYVAKCGNMVIEAGISRELSEDYKLFLQKFGIRAKLKKDKRGNNHRVYVYSLKELHRLRGLVITSEHKQKRFLEILNTTTPFQTFKREKIVQSNYEKEDETYDIEVENNHNYIANGYIVHNSGKDKTLMNLMAKKMMERIGTYFYFFPTYNQGKKILWEGRDKDGFKFTDHIPEDLRVRTNASEMLIEIKNGSIFQIIGTDNIDCYDDKTEILTINGWKLFKNLKRNEEVATLNDGYLEYEVPSNHVEYDFNGDMHRLESKAIDLLVTPNHKFFVKSRKGIYKFKEIQDKTILNDSIPSTCKWKGDNNEYFVLPEIKRNKADHCKNKNQKFKMEHWCAFMGIYLSEGSTFSDNRGNYRVFITQSEEKHQDIVEEIKWLLCEMGLKFNYDNKNFVIQNKQLFEYCKQFGKCHEKYIPKDLKKLDIKYLQILKDWLVKGDGSIHAGQESYYSTSKKLIDDFQEIIIKLGYSGNIRIKKQSSGFIGGRKVQSKLKLYTLIIRKSKFKYFRDSKDIYIKKEKYIGKVYCVDVKNHVIKVRRNGFESWCGNSIVGTNTIGCVFSEYALQNPDAWRFIRPILAENGGWAVFNFTPRGKNHGHDIYQLAKRSPDWFCEKLTVDDTGAIPKKVLEQEKMEIIEDTGDDALFYQEYYCSFDAPMQGSYYGKEMTRAEEENRITKVPHDSELLVDTWWDLGIGDSTCIWFVQTVGNEVRIIDYYENSGEGLAHYIAELASLREKNDYVYRYHNAPHDIEVRELGTGKSRYETAYELGIAFHIVPNIPVEDGINAVRALLKRCWFDDEKCKQGLNALRCYHKEWDDKRMEFKPKPFHDWSCLSGNTKIRTLNGWVPIKEMKGDEYVWGYSFSEHRLIPTKISFAGKTGSNVQLLEIGLDNNKSIKCTPEHLFLMRDESYKRADELITGDSLMPFYETPNRGYTQINLNDGSFADEHRFVYYRFHKKPDLGNHVNHIDSNHFNNNPENLSELTPDAHCSETFTGLNNTDRKLIDKTDYNREFYSGKELYKICKNCGKEYWGSFKTVYCSDKCRKKYRIKRDRDGLVLSRGKEAVNKRNREAYWKKKNHKVRFIKMAGKEDVYDLTVPETSNFVAEGIVVHNSHGADAFRMLAVGHMDEQRGPEKETDYNEDYDRFALI